MGGPLEKKLTNLPDDGQDDQRLAQARGCAGIGLLQDVVLEVGVAQDVRDESQEEGQSQEEGHHPGDALALVVRLGSQSLFVMVVLPVTVDPADPTVGGQVYKDFATAMGLP